MLYLRDIFRISRILTVGVVRCGMVIKKVLIILGHTPTEKFWALWGTADSLLVAANYYFGQIAVTEHS